VGIKITLEFDYEEQLEFGAQKGWGFIFDYIIGKGNQPKVKNVIEKLNNARKRGIVLVSLIVETKTVSNFC
jgi:hypothetical protein